MTETGNMPIRAAQPEPHTIPIAVRTPAGAPPKTELVRGCFSSVPGLVLTTLHPAGHTWQVTHAASGARLTHRAWPTADQADAAVRACCAGTACGVDWTRPAAELVSVPEAMAAAERLEEWIG